MCIFTSKRVTVSTSMEGHQDHAKDSPVKCSTGTRKAAPRPAVPADADHCGSFDTRWPQASRAVRPGPSLGGRLPTARCA